MTPIRRCSSKQKREIKLYEDSVNVSNKGYSFKKESKLIDIMIEMDRFK